MLLTADERLTVDDWRRSYWLTTELLVDRHPFLVATTPARCPHSPPPAAAQAFYAWSWWTVPGDTNTFAHHRRTIHYREHFVTNVATAGGLMLLQKIGAGKYSVDELLKKTD